MKAEPLPAGDRLARLHSEFDQSPWLDNLRRRWITDGDLRRWVDRGIRGLTSNPSIFQKAISQSSDYDEQFADLVRSGTATESAYWHLVTDDIGGALDALAPVHDSSDGADGFVSVEVDPGLARDTDATLAAARRLSESIDRPNLMVKIPGTEEGLPAVRAMIGEGRSVNVTLIFSVERYRQVAEAYLAGLEDLLA
ncbi:MAG TPA: transaldolase, partial [Acidimicrobiaceae bacterium]|nr:transaldolase [Acidimicrobiaceae bacterium]